MRSNKFYGRDWLSPEIDWTKEEWESLLKLAEDLKTKFALNEDTTHILKGKTLYTMFFNSSLRTRSTFAAGIQQLGGFHVDLEPGKTYTPARKGFEVPYKTERICDVAQVLSRTGDAIAIRMYGKPAHWIYGFAHETMKEFAHYADIPIINMECDKYHPSQALADMLTIKEKFGEFKGKKFVISWAYSGSTAKPVAVPQSLALVPSLLGMDVVLARPKGFELDPEVIKKCKEYADMNNATFEETDDMEEAFEGGAAALMAVICSPETVQPVDRVEIEVAALGRAENTRPPAGQPLGPARDKRDQDTGWMLPGQAVQCQVVVVRIEAAAERDQVERMARIEVRGPAAAGRRRRPGAEALGGG